MTNDGAAWDERYWQEDQLFSGRPNGALVAEVAGMAPGRALDVGCGEGGDTAWLVEHGWRVTALDVSRVALDRAKRSVGAAAATIEWVRWDPTYPTSWRTGLS